MELKGVHVSVTNISVVDLFLLIFTGGSSTSKQEEVKRLPGGKIKKKVRII